MIGPYRGGRVTAVAGIRSQPFTFYMGPTGGGVWKTTNAGRVVEQRLGRGPRRRVDRRHRGRRVRPQRRLRRDRLGLPPRQRLGGRRRVPVDRRREELDPHRPPRGGADRAHPGAPAATPTVVYVAALGHIFGRNEERGRLPLERRRGDLGEGALRVRRHRGGRPRDEPPESPGALRRHVAGRAQALDPRSTGAPKGAVQDHRRRRHLGQGARGCPLRGRRGGLGRRHGGTHRRERLAGEPRSGVGPGHREGRGRRALPLRRRGRERGRRSTPTGAC